MIHAHWKRLQYARLLFLVLIMAWTATPRRPRSKGDAIDYSTIKVFWNEASTLSKTQARMLACNNVGNFTFVLKRAMYKQVEDIDCAIDDLARSCEASSSTPNTATMSNSSSSSSSSSSNLLLAPNLFYDQVWEMLTVADIRLATLWQAFKPHEHIDTLMDLVSRSSIFYVSWSEDYFYDLLNSTKCRELQFLINISYNMPEHERPKLLELPTPIEDLLHPETSAFWVDVMRKSLERYEDYKDRHADLPYHLHTKKRKCHKKEYSYRCEDVPDHWVGLKKEERSATKVDDDDDDDDDKKANRAVTLDDTAASLLENRRFNSWGIERVFNHETSEMIRKVAKAAHESWLAGGLPDPELDPDGAYCRSTKMTDTDRKLAAQLVVAVDAQSFLSSSQPSLAALAAAAAAAGAGTTAFDASVGPSQVQLSTAKESSIGRRSGTTPTVAKPSTTTLAAEESISGESFIHVSPSHHQRWQSSDNRTEEEQRGTGGVRILCLTYTITPYHAAVRDVRSTWGKRCDGYIAASNASDHDLSALHIGPAREHFQETYNEMWLKAQVMWKLVGSILIDDYDFFLIGGDDLYVVVENLREYLNSDEVTAMGKGEKPLYIGRRLRQNAYIEFNTGGAGYVLNKAAVASLYYEMDETGCIPGISTSMEDVMVGQCLRFAGIYPVEDTSDERDPVVSLQTEIPGEELLWEDLKKGHLGHSAARGRERFHPQNPNTSYWAPHDWYRGKAVSFGVGDNCCSKHSITYQDIRGDGYMKCFHSAVYRSNTMRKD